VSLPLVKTDLRERRLPNRLVLPVLASSIVFTALASTVLNDWSRFWYALLTSFTVFFFGVWLNLRGQLGMGDVKLATALAQSIAWFSPHLAFAALVVAFSAAMVQILVLHIKRRRRFGSRPSDSLAFGPYLLLGFAVTLAWVGGTRELPELELLGWASHGQHIEQHIELL
jgi:leader peptidase (prepilin peptidase)/N-methyltransferase